MLQRLDELAADEVSFPSLPVRLAAWFHDAVYDGERDAEERSANRSEHALDGLVDPDIVAEVARLVRLTETHDPEPQDVAGCALSDADLAILAAPTGRYAAYTEQVRREYAHVDDATFAVGRARLLRGLVARPTFFRTAPGHDRWETPARANLGAELARLDQAATP
ncbi:MAG: HD domain-containing protein [Egibacteraceae bacterium]